MALESDISPPPQSPTNLSTPVAHKLSRVANGQQQLQQQLQQLLLRPQAPPRAEEPPTHEWPSDRLVGRVRAQLSTLAGTFSGAQLMPDRHASAAHERGCRDVCFHFPQVGAADLALQARAGGAERALRLLEAELHVYKLAPPTAADQLAEPAGVRTAAQAGNLYQLRTNLLEVSIYQVLPNKSSALGASKQPADGRVGSSARRSIAPDTAGEHKRAANDTNLAMDVDFPLRLLDIRRIDLHSAGWETFYVKRALEDWISDPALNLGLVIKAKSLFDEQLPVGLVRFADAYERRWPPPAGQAEEGEGGGQTAYAQATRRPPNYKHTRLPRNTYTPGAPSVQAGRGDNNGSSADGLARPADREFQFDHQPILVIYTAGEHARNELEQREWLADEMAA